jgi:hypothetical protein
LPLANATADGTAFGQRPLRFQNFDLAALSPSSSLPAHGLAALTAVSRHGGGVSTGR